MVKSNSPLLHSASLQFSFPEATIFTNFLHIVLHICSAFPNMLVWLGRMGHITQTVLHLAFVALQCILESFLYLFLQSCPILLKNCIIAACKSSAGDSNAQTGLGVTNRLLKEFRRSFLEMLIP